MKITLRMLFVVWWIGISLTSAAPIELFNGKDFEGWTFDIISSQIQPEEIWTVEEGIITCKGRPLSVVRTNDEYENYELTLEWRWTAEPGNSGVLVHSSAPRERGVWPKSIEVQLAHGSAGDFWLIGETISVDGRPAIGRRIPKNEASPEKPPGEWNELRIRCEGDTITVHINGLLVNKGHSASTTRGAVCIQSEGRPTQFRNLRLHPLQAPATPSEPESD